METQSAVKKSCHHCEYKATPRSSELKSGVSRRINRAIGQLNGIKTMINEDRYCGDVLIQLAAVESRVTQKLLMRLWTSLSVLCKAALWIRKFLMYKE